MGRVRTSFAEGARTPDTATYFAEVRLRVGATVLKAVAAPARAALLDFWTSRRRRARKYYVTPLEGGTRILENFAEIFFAPADRSETVLVAGNAVSRFSAHRRYPNVSGDFFTRGRY